MFTVLTDSVDPRPLALCRIVVGLVAAGFAFEWIRVLARASSGKYLALPAIEGLPAPSQGVVIGLFCVSLIASAAMVFGFAGRMPAFLVAAATAAVLLSDQQTYSNHLVLLTLLALFLGLSGAAQTWTVIRSRRAGDVPYWPVFLIKVLVTSLYAWTAIAKINPQYLSGEVLGTFLQPWVPIPQHLLPAAALLSIVTEACLAVVLWVPKLRILAFALGVGLHVGIVVLLQDPAPLVGFGALMATGYILFAWGTPRRTALLASSGGQVRNEVAGT